MTRPAGTATPGTHPGETAAPGARPGETAARATKPGDVAKGATRATKPGDVAETAVLVALFLIPLVFASWLHHVYPVPKAAVFRAAVGVILVTGFVTLAGGNRRLLVFRLPDLLLVVFLAWMGLAALLSPWPVASLLGTPPRFEGWVGFAGYGAFYAVASRMRSGSLEILAKAIAAAAAVVGLLAVLEVHGWFRPVGYQAFGARVTAGFGNPLYVGAFAALALPLTAGLVLRASAWTSRAGYASFLGLQTVALYYSFGRGAWLGAAAGLLLTAGLLVWSARGRAGRLRPLAAPGALIVAVLVLALGASIITAPAAARVGAGRVAEAAAGGGTVATRLLMWRTTATLIAERPVVGWGPETFMAEFAEVRPLRLLQLEDYTSYPDRPHNHWLYLAYAGGLPALGLYLAFLAALAWGGLRALRHPGAVLQTRVALAALTGAAAAYEIQALFSFSLPMYTPHALVVEGALVSLAWRTDRLPRPGGCGPRPRTARRWSRAAGLPGRFVPVAGTALLLLALPFFVDGVRQTWADVVYARGARDPADALSRLRRAASLSPRDALYARSLGQAYEQAAASTGDPRQLDLAEEAYLRGQEGRPRDPDLPLFLANLYRKRGKTEQARDTYRAILEHDPYHPGALFNLASLSLELNRPEEAAPLLERLTSFALDDAEAWYLLGMARERTGDRTGAGAAYERALNVKPDYPEAGRALSRLESSP